jgi:hypothetical protein
MSRYSEVETHPTTHQESCQTPRWQERGSVDDALRPCTGGTASLPATQEPPCGKAFFTQVLHREVYGSLHSFCTPFTTDRTARDPDFCEVGVTSRFGARWVSVAVGFAPASLKNG